jgi:hypothetical protein
MVIKIPQIITIHKPQIITFKTPKNVYYVKFNTIINF